MLLRAKFTSRNSSAFSTQQHLSLSLLSTPAPDHFTTSPTSAQLGNEHYTHRSIIASRVSPHSSIVVVVSILPHRLSHLRDHTGTCELATSSSFALKQNSTFRQPPNFRLSSKFHPCYRQDWNNMEPRPPSIPQPPFPRPSLFSTAPQHSRQYGSSQPQTSRPEARSHTTYDSLRRPADEPARTTPTYGYAAHSYNPDLRAQARSTSPTRFGSMQSDAAKRSALASPVKNNGTLGKDNSFYRDGKEHSPFVSKYPLRASHT